MPYSDKEILEDLISLSKMVPEVKRLRRKILRYIRENKKFVSGERILYKINYGYLHDLNTVKAMSEAEKILKKKGI